MDMLVGVPFAMAAIAWLVNLGPGPAHHRARRPGARPRAGRPAIAPVRA